jgi:hypothetical protein
MEEASFSIGPPERTLTEPEESPCPGITYPNSSTNTFTYNGLDTRVSKVDSSGTSTYRRDGAYVTDPVLSDGSLTHTPGISTRSGSTTTYQHSDWLGSNIRQTDSSEATTNQLRTDAFGMVMSPSGTHSRSEAEIPSQKACERSEPGRPLRLRRPARLPNGRRQRPHAPRSPLLRPQHGPVLDEGSDKGRPELVWVL